jgi:hypothetical protein
MNETTAFPESLRITKVIFNAIYAKEFKNREAFDEFLIDLLKKEKPDNAEYTYYSLYLRNTFTIHVNVVINKSFSPTTFIFCMIWDVDGSGKKLEDRFTTFNLDSIATYIGTPAYWFGRNENTNVVMEVKDERVVVI